MRGELKRIQHEFGISFIHVTHTQMEAIALADMVVVMDQGHIEQAASARDVFDRPRTAYVARFIGGQNVLSGAVAEVGGGAVTIDSGGKKVMISAPTPLPAVGSNFQVAVRRDRVRLTRAPSERPPPALNTVHGRVSAMEYQGSWLKIVLEDACGEEFVVNQADSIFFADPLDMGDAVTATWLPEEVHYLTRGAEKHAGMTSVVAH
jgi:putative spermidine/putrescine transport system ATP-binding protein